MSRVVFVGCDTFLGCQKDREKMSSLDQGVGHRLIPTLPARSGMPQFLSPASHPASSPKADGGPCFLSETTAQGHCGCVDSNTESTPSPPVTRWGYHVFR